MFGMGTGGAPLIGSPGKINDFIVMGRVFPERQYKFGKYTAFLGGEGVTENMVKPHGRLVLVG